MKQLLRFLILFFSAASAVTPVARAQTASFSAPDTICEDMPVTLTDVLPNGGTRYRWSFCSGNTGNIPDGINMGNPGQVLNAPRFVIIVTDNGRYYTFTTSGGNGRVLRCFYGITLANPPLVSTNLGNFGVLTDKIKGIQVIRENNNWYGIVLDGNKMVRLLFGNSLDNNPTAETVVMTGVTEGCGLTLQKDGGNWIGFFTDIAANKLFRMDFAANPGNDPLVTDLGDPAQLNAPAGLVVAKDQGNWSGFICNSGNSTLSRISFGSSMLNPAPAGTVLPGLNRLLTNIGITLVTDCGGTHGFVTNNLLDSDHSLVRLVFTNGLGGTVTSGFVANNGVLNKPYGISDFIREGDTLYAYAANNGSTSLTKILFPSCSGASQPFYVGQNPPPVTYPDPGSYNVLLTVDDASGNETSACRKIIVVPKPEFSLGPNLKLCTGSQAVLDAGPVDSVYLWSTGATTRTISVSDSGKYWARITTRSKCESSDTVWVTLKPTAAGSVDTSLCNGLSYWAQHAYRTKPGTYYDTLTAINGCDSVVATKLSFYECNPVILFPNAFTPNGDGLNDIFHPTLVNISAYTLRIFDRWGTMLFETSDQGAGWNGLTGGTKAPPGVYSYDAIYEAVEEPGVTKHARGTVTLLE